jgi:hypothetical protein
MWFALVLPHNVTCHLCWLSYTPDELADAKLQLMDSFMKYGLPHPLEE